MRNISRSTIICLVALLVYACSGCDDAEVVGFDCPDEGSDFYSADTKIGDLYEFCFGSNDECRNYSLDLLLYLDVVNLPNPEISSRYVSVQSVPGLGGSRDRLSFLYGDSLVGGAYDLMRGQPGWKAKMVNVNIEFCDECFTNCGLAKIIELVGNPEDVEFVFDPEDTLEIYIERTVIE